MALDKSLLPGDSLNLHLILDREYLLAMDLESDEGETQGEG